MLKHMAPLIRGAHLLAKKNYDGFLFMWYNFNLKPFCFGATPDIMMRVDSLCRPTGSTSFRARVRGLIT